MKQYQVIYTPFKAAVQIWRELASLWEPEEITKACATACNTSFAFCLNNLSVYISFHNECCIVYNRHVIQLSVKQVVAQTKQEFILLANTTHKIGKENRKEQIMFQLQMEKLKSDFESSLQRYSRLQNVNIFCYIYYTFFA